jgi:elongation factor P--(R)-beta-lysine ligase
VSAENNVTLEESSRLSSIKSKLERRALILNGVRAFFYSEDFIEVETPLRVPAIAPEQFINPYLSEGWFLSTSPELQMKRLLSGGYNRVFQICHCFRKDERGRHHNPEFTMLEWYRAGANYRHIIRDTERLVLDLSIRMGNDPVLTYQSRKIDLTLPWPEITVREAYLRWAGWDPVANFNGPRFDDDMADKVIPNFPADRPTVILDYPCECASLARLKADPHTERPVAERAEVFIGGLEIANGFSELNDAIEQKRRFKHEMEIMQREGKPATLPRKFLDSVRFLPECSGNAVGIDRLVMLLTDSSSIDEVMAFPVDML